MRGFKGLGRLVFLLVLAVVLIFGPAVRVEAGNSEADYYAQWQDGAGDEVADTANGWLQAAVQIAQILLVIGGTTLLLFLGKAVYEKYAPQLKQVDVNLDVLKFGNSIPGKTLNDVLSRLLPQLDDANDPLIRAALALPILRDLHKRGMIDGKQLSDWTGRLVADAIRLTNGAEDVTFSLLGFDSTLGPSQRAQAEGQRVMTGPQLESAGGQYPNG